MKGKPIYGGQTFTDLPIRRIVYPSHGIECENATGTILVSYPWSQDATRLGTRITRKTPSQEKSMSEAELVEDILEQLELIHGPYVRDEYMGEYYMMNWNDNPLSMGAFGLFGPSQYSNLYRSMIRPEADGHMHFAGDTTSVHHGKNRWDF